MFTPANELTNISALQTRMNVNIDRVMCLPIARTHWVALRVPASLVTSEMVFIVKVRIFSVNILSQDMKRLLKRNKRCPGATKRFTPIDLIN